MPKISAALHHVNCFDMMEILKKDFHNGLKTASETRLFHSSHRLGDG